MLRFAARTLACLALALPAFSACGRPVSPPPGPPPIDEPTPDDDATTTPADATPAPVPDARPPREATATADTMSAPESRSPTPATCLTPGASALPRCAANPQAQGCPLDIPATAVVSVAVLELAGYDDLGDHALDEHVPLLVLCYGEALAGAPEAPVVVEATLDVAPNGCATVRRISGDWPTRRMHDCVKGVLQWLALPAPESDDGARIVLRLEFVS